MRKKIPEKIEGQIIFKSDRTCCVCHVKVKGFQINHIDGNNQNNKEDNLCVLCLDCHDEFHTTSRISKKLTPEALRLFKKHWEKTIKKRRNLESKLENNSIESIKIRRYIKRNVPVQKNQNWIIAPDEGKYDFSTGTLRHIPDPQTLNALGYIRKKFIRWDRKKFDSKSIGHPIESVRKAELIRKGKTSGVYLIIEGEKRWVPDPKTLVAMGRNFDEVKEVDEKLFYSIPQGIAIIKSSDWYKSF